MSNFLHKLFKFLYQIFQQSQEQNKVLKSVAFFATQCYASIILKLFLEGRA